MILYLCQEILKGQVQANEKSPKDLDFDRKGVGEVLPMLGLTILMTKSSAKLVELG